MATLVLQVAGSAIGTALGGPIGGAIGQALGGLAGASIDQQLMGSAGGGRRFVEGPRLKTLDGISANEGTAIPRVYGRVRLGGQIIWATKFEEHAESQRQGRSGGKSAQPAQPATVTTSYSYFANLAIALCEGPVAMLRRVWADGKPLDLSTVTLRFYPGDETQMPDPLIVARQATTPAYRGIAYVVFERLPLAAFGNRLPQLTFEVIRPAPGIAQRLRGVDLIPGATEFGYYPASVSRKLGYGSSAPENRNQLTAASDFEASMDALQALCPNLTSVALTAAWFGTDLRAGECRIKPGVDNLMKVTTDHQWEVAGLSRLEAHQISQVEGRAAYGGTPTDLSLKTAIADMKARGLDVVFYPFLMMDVPAGNTLQDPASGADSQPAYPWRGRIKALSGAMAANDIAGFFGTVLATDFTVSNGAVSYTGPEEWSYSRFILQSAALCKAAGGVGAFLIGSEMVGLTHQRVSDGSYPFVMHLKTLAAEVRTLLGASTRIGYAADWTEYGAKAEGQNLMFPLDPLWSDAHIDFIGIDFYAPVTDWRDGTDHLDATEAGNIGDLDYLTRRLAGGEAFDWYYASPADRDAQIRTSITDGAYQKPWVYRAKDLVNWWANAHVARVNGVETAATGWAPRSKPIWLTEVGCPAVDKGSNAPNVFPDPKSSENGLPYYSSGRRDDAIQTRFLEAVHRRFDPDHPDFEALHNPLSPIYGGRMVDPARIHIWAWDARPYPAFPHLSSVWGDGDNWITGHWLNGRIEGMTLENLVRQICTDYGLPPPDCAGLKGFVEGYTIDRPMAARAALEPLEQLFAFDVGTSAGRVRMVGRASGVTVQLDPQDFVPDKSGAELSRVRAQETELPRQITVSFADAEQDYRRATVASRRLSTLSRREQGQETTAVLRRAEAERLTEILLQDAWIGRETADFALPPSYAGLEPGDMVTVTHDGVLRQFLITKVVDGRERRISARAIEPAVFEMKTPNTPLAAHLLPRLAGPPAVMVMNLPAASGSPSTLTHLALRADPWAGPYVLWKSRDGTSFEADSVINRAAIMGKTLTAFPAGPLWRWDKAATLSLQLHGGQIASISDGQALAGANLLAVQGTEGAWEIISPAQAHLTDTGVWTISRLLRGLAGSEQAASSEVPAGAPVVVLDGAVIPLFDESDGIGATATFRVAPADRDHADPASLEFMATAGASALLPLPPVHGRAQRTAAGIELSWLRRTRLGGDNWEVLEVPVSESRERYALEILSGTAVVRRIELDKAGYLYPLADELAAFGTAQSSLTCRLAQISDLAGSGPAFTHILPVISA